MGRAWAEALATAAWAVGVAAVYLLLAVALHLEGWALIAGQAVATAVQVLPLLLLRPALPLGWTRARGAVSAVLLLAGTVAGAILVPAGIGTHLRGAAASVLSGVGEEAVFRGLITDRLRRTGLRAPARVVLNAVLFGVLHVPVAILRGDGVPGIGVPFAFGLVFAVLRERSGGLLLPTALHVAVDLSGS